MCACVCVGREGGGQKTIFHRVNLESESPKAERGPHPLSSPNLSSSTRAFLFSSDSKRDVQG